MYMFWVGIWPPTRLLQYSIYSIFLSSKVKSLWYTFGFGRGYVNICVGILMHTHWNDVESGASPECSCKYIVICNVDCTIECISRYMILFCGARPRLEISPRHRIYYNIYFRDWMVWMCGVYMLLWLIRWQMRLQKVQLEWVGR